MGASRFEQQLAQKSGVTIHHWVAPAGLATDAAGAVTVDFEKTKLDDNGKLVGTGETISLEADMVFKAIGQKLDDETTGDALAELKFQGERIVVDASQATIAQEGLGRRRLRCGWRRPDRVGRATRQGRGDRNRSRDKVTQWLNLKSEFLGISSPNPFWLASAPPTDKAYNVNRAFEAGWGGVVWKTLGEDPPIVNVNGPRYSALYSNERRVIGFNNIELITDRPLAGQS